MRNIQNINIRYGSYVPVPMTLLTASYCVCVPEIGYIEIFYINKI